MTLRHYNNGEAEFILEPVNDSVVKVTHRGQVGWIGISLDWDPQRPYTTTTFSHRLKRGRHRTNRIGVRHPRRRNEVPVLVAAAPAEKGGLPESEP